MHNFTLLFLCNTTIFRFNALISWDIKEMKLTGGRKCSKMALIKFGTLKNQGVKLGNQDKSGGVRLK